MSCPVAIGVVRRRGTSRAPARRSRPRASSDTMWRSDRGRRKRQSRELSGSRRGCLTYLSCATMGAMENGDRVPLIVLAGGASRRMGTDKRAMMVDGAPMLLRTLKRLAPTPCIVVVDPRAPLGLSLPAHARVVADTRPGEGPLAALEAGLLTTHAPIALVVAGDMPLLEPSVLHLLADRLDSDPDATLTCLADEGGPRPLPLAVRRVPVLRQVTAVLDGGERRLRALLAAAAVIPIAEWLPLDPIRGSLRDIDTPADLVAVR